MGLYEMYQNKNQTHLLSISRLDFLLLEVLCPPLSTLKAHRPGTLTLLEFLRFEMKLPLIDPGITK